MKPVALINRPAGRVLSAIVLSGILSGIYVRGGGAWVLGFVMVVPWLRVLDTRETLASSLLNASLMSVAFTAAAFSWFGMAIGNYTQLGAVTGLSVLLVAAPLFQPQFLAFALVRYLVGLRHGPVVRALAAASAWVGMEWIAPKILGDSLGYGLYPSPVLRQVADLGGAAGLTVLLLLANEGIAFALARRPEGLRRMLKPLALAGMVPALMAGYGYLVLSASPAPTGNTLRMGLIQSDLVDYEQRRQEVGAHAVVREVLDTHFAMSYDAVVRHRADAVLWSETAYPTTFTHPKSEAGAEFDGEIQSMVNAAGVPFVFGTYDRDAAGEYNAAAVVTPVTGLMGFYRKTRLFPLTEYVPGWLDGPTLRSWLPWTGAWLPGDGARVFPLRLRDGREIPVLPSICLDDVDPGLAIAGARLGAQAILTMSNDSWFTHYPQGAELHHTVAAFRSIETRLPQFRVTSNGYSAVIDATGRVVAGSQMGERTLVVGELPVPVPPRTLMVAWGDWVGLAGCLLLAWLTLLAASSRWRKRRGNAEPTPAVATSFPTDAFVLPATARVVTGMLRGFARASLLWMGAAMLLSDSLRGNSLAQIRLFAGCFLAPEAAAWCVLFAFSARVSVENGMLVLMRGKQRLEVALRDIAAIELWRLPIPGPGVSLRLTSGNRWHYGLALAHPIQLAQALSASGAAPVQEAQATISALYAQARDAMVRGRFDSPWMKFVVFPMLLALPAFHLHQNIAYGGVFGEYYTFGLKAYLITLALWWAAWTIGVVLSAAALRAVIETGTLLSLLVRPAQTVDVRQMLEHVGLALLYLGLPGWLLLHAGW